MEPISDAEVAAIVVGITELVKNAGLPSKYCPLFAVAFSIALTIGNAIYIGSQDYYSAAMRGLIIGLTTTGVYASADTMIKKSTPTITHANSPQETH